MFLGLGYLPFVFIIFSFSVASGDAIISGSQVQVLITGDENLSDKNQKKEIYSKNAVTNTAQTEEKESFQKNTAGR